MTTIEWTDATWNPVRGCSRVSAGCDNCYAMGVAHRFSGPGMPYEGLTRIGKRGVDWAGKAVLVPSVLGQPLRWQRPRRVFVNSMSDLFHESLSEENIAEVFGVMAVAAKPFGGRYVQGKGWTNQLGPHRFQVLTKRSRRMNELLISRRFRKLVAQAAYRWAIDRVDAGWLEQCVSGEREPGNHCSLDEMWPLPNVWLGVSVEDQRTADERIPLLLQCPAAVRFVSYEPALGPVDFSRWLQGGTTVHMCADVAGMLRNRTYFGCVKDSTGRTLAGNEARRELESLLASGVRVIQVGECDDFDDQKGCRGHRKPGLNWLIVGGESGHGARPFEVAWARSTVTQCREAGVACFVKQLGGRPVDAGVVEDPHTGERIRTTPPFPVPLRHRKGGDWSEWPEDLRVREFPEAATR